MSEIQIGTRVAYSRAFLQSTQQLTGPAHFAWGVVTALEPLSFGVAIASVAWTRLASCPASSTRTSRRPS